MTDTNIAPEAVEGGLSPAERERFSGAQPAVLLDAAQRVEAYAERAGLPAGTSKFLAGGMLADRVRQDAAGDAPPERPGGGGDGPPAEQPDSATSVPDDGEAPGEVAVRDVTPRPGLSVRTFTGIADDGEEDERADVHDEEPEDDTDKDLRAAFSRVTALPATGRPGAGAEPQASAERRPQVQSVAEPREHVPEETPADGAGGDALVTSWRPEITKSEEELRDEFADEAAERAAAAIPDSTVEHLTEVLTGMGGQSRPVPQDGAAEAVAPAGPDRAAADPGTQGTVQPGAEAGLEGQSEAALQELLGMAHPTSLPARAVDRVGEEAIDEALSALDGGNDDRDSSGTRPMSDESTVDDRSESAGEGGDADRVRVLEARLTEEVARRRDAEQRAGEHEELNLAKERELQDLRRAGTAGAAPGNRGAHRNGRTPDPVPPPRDAHPPVRRRRRGGGLLMAVIGLVAIGAGMVGGAAVVDPRTWPVRQVVPAPLLEQVAVLLGHRPATLAVGAAVVEVSPTLPENPPAPDPSGLADAPLAVDRLAPLSTDPLAPAGGGVLPSAGPGNAGAGRQERMGDAVPASQAPPPVTAEPLAPGEAPGVPGAGQPLPGRIDRDDTSASGPAASVPLAREPADRAVFPQAAEAPVPTADTDALVEARIVRLVRTELAPLQGAIEQLAEAMGEPAGQEPGGPGTEDELMWRKEVLFDIASLGAQIEDLETAITRMQLAAAGRNDEPGYAEERMQLREISRYRDRPPPATGPVDVAAGPAEAAAPGPDPAQPEREVVRPAPSGPTQDWRPGRVYVAPATSFRVTSRVPAGVTQYQVGDWVPGYGHVLNVTTLPGGRLISTENGALYQAADGEGHARDAAEQGPARPQ